MTTPIDRGRFVVLEGGEGCGKSTQARLLADRLRADGVDVVTTREPGGTPLAEDVRALVLDPSRDVDPRAEALLYAAARAQHAADVIRPAMAAGRWVVCDRFDTSSVVYQGIARGLGADAVAALTRFACAHLVPDVTVVLAVDADVGLARAAAETGGDGSGDRMERAGLDFHRTVNDAFVSVAAHDPSRRYAVVDTVGRTIDEVADDVWGAVASLRAGTP